MRFILIIFIGVVNIQIIIGQGLINPIDSLLQSVMSNPLNNNRDFLSIKQSRLYGLRELSQYDIGGSLNRNKYQVGFVLSYKPWVINRLFSTYLSLAKVLGGGCTIGGNLNYSKIYFNELDKKREYGLLFGCKKQWKKQFVFITLIKKSDETIGTSIRFGGGAKISSNLNYSINVDLSVIGKIGVGVQYFIHYKLHEVLYFDLGLQMKSGTYDFDVSIKKYNCILKSAFNYHIDLGFSEQLILTKLL